MTAGITVTLFADTAEPLSRPPLECAISGLMHPQQKDRYSITSSASESGVAGISMPSALAVLRLITSLNLSAAAQPTREQCTAQKPHQLLVRSGR
jgi:hypothetical protein